ncbi:MAG: hypothetical protein OXF64_05990 [bacterium]|nr:hypothetical protein [bacterium]MCY4273693.1 hypothetical protein [bacterium]
MRPTLTEQIEGARRVLVELLAPEVSDAHAREQAAYAAAALQHAAARWPHVLADLVADIRALEEVLGLDPAELAEAVGGVPDFASAEDYHRGLRSQLADEIKAGPEPSAAVRAYLADSVERLK